MKSKESAAKIMTVKNSEETTNLRISESVSLFRAADSGMKAMTAKATQTEKARRALDSLYSEDILRVNHAITKDPKTIITIETL